MRQLFKSRHIHALVKRLRYMYNNDCCGVQCQQITKQSSSCIITTFVDDCCRMKNQGRERIKNVSKDKRQRAKGKNSMTSSRCSSIFLCVSYNYLLMNKKMSYRTASVSWERVQKQKCQEKAQVLTSAVTIHSFICVQHTNFHKIWQWSDALETYCVHINEKWAKHP